MADASAQPAQKEFSVGPHAAFVADGDFFSRRATGGHLVAQPEIAVETGYR